MATKQEILSKLAASHEQRISKVLFDLEEDIIAQLQRATDGIPLTTELAIQLRPNLKQLIEKNYLKEGSKIISEYDEVVKGYMDYIRTTPVSDKFKTLTKPDLKIINQLKQLSFSGFEDVANRFLDTIATEIYSSAVTGKPFPQVVENIRASINGVYRRSNEEAVNRLVRIVEENRYSDDPLAKKKYLDARKILHSKYASDIRGENMRKYANQIAHDSIMQFDGQFTKYKGQEAGINTYKYTGTNITTTRQFCRANLNEIKTEEEWREVFTGNWRGKSGSDPFVNRGGYRCRHSLIPYDPAWDAIEEVQAKVQPKATNIKTSDDANINPSSLSNRIKETDMKLVNTAFIAKDIKKRMSENAKDKRYARKNGKPVTKYKGGEFAGQGYLSKAFNEYQMTAIHTVLQELDDLAIKYNVPKIRGILFKPDMGIHTRGNMGDGVMGINANHHKMENKFSGKKLEVSTWSQGKSMFSEGSDRMAGNIDKYFDNDLDRLRTTMYHEFAHHIHQQKYMDYDSFISRPYKYKSPLEKKLTKFVSKSQYAAWKMSSKKRRKELFPMEPPTLYGMTNELEWFAENFAAYEMGKLDVVDPNFIKFLKEEVID